MQQGALLVLRRTAISLGVLSLGFLSGCTSVDEVAKSPYVEGVPVHPEFAKRAYNKPYEIMGTTYYPRNCYNYSEEGDASYYGGRDVFHGRKTSMGHTFDKDYLTGAHKELPIPCIVNVTNLCNGRTLKIKINDRGPFVPGRIIDVSEKAARLLGFYQQGIARVRVEVCVNDTLELIRAMPSAAQAKVLEGKKPKKASVKDKTPKQKKKKSTPIHDENLLVSRHMSDVKEDKAFQKVLESKAVSKKIFVDVGTFNNLSDAQKMASKVAHTHKIQQSKVSKQKKYRLLVGPFQNKDQAKQVLKKFAKVGAKSAKVVS